MTRHGRNSPYNRSPVPARTGRFKIAVTQRTGIPQFPQVAKFRGQIFLGTTFAAAARSADIFDNNVSFHSRLRFRCEFIVGECKEIVERAAPIVQRNPFVVKRLPDIESIGQTVPRDLTMAFVMNPNHIGQSLQPVAVPDYLRSFSASIRSRFRKPCVRYSTQSSIFFRVKTPIRFGSVCLSKALP